MWRLRTCPDLALMLCVLVLLASAGGCQCNGPGRAEGEAKPGPGVQPAESAPEPRTTTQPAQTQPAETQPTTTQAAEEPELPDYVTVLQRYDSLDTIKFEARFEPGNHMVIDTHNIRRMRLERHKLPLDRQRRIVLQLDGQGIVWSAGSAVSEFERSSVGEWVPVRPTHIKPGEKNKE